MGWCEVTITMPLSPMGCQHAGQCLLTGSIKTKGWFIEQPERRVARPPAGTGPGGAFGRPIDARWPINQMGQVKCRQGQMRPCPDLSEGHMPQ